MISRICSGNFQQIYIIPVSGDYSHFISKICQIVAGTSMTSQFHEVLKILIFGGFLLFVPTLSRLVNQNISSLIDCRSIWLESFMYV